MQDCKVLPSEKSKPQVDSCMQTATGSSSSTTPDLQLVVEASRLSERDAAAQRQATPAQDAFSQLLHCRKLC